jgi:hypothetical protein
VIFRRRSVCAACGYRHAELLQQHAGANGQSNHDLKAPQRLAGASRLSRCHGIEQQRTSGKLCDKKYPLQIDGVGKLYASRSAFR